MRYSLCAFVFACFGFADSILAEDISLQIPPHQLARSRLPLESWSAVGFDLLNAGESDDELLVTTFFTQEPDLQYGRRIWLPPDSIRSGWFLLKTPPTDGLGNDQEAKELNARVLRQSGDIETIVSIDQGRLWSGFIRCSNLPSESLVIADPDDMESDSFANAAREAASQRGRCLRILEFPLPPVAEAYDGLSHIILASDQIGDSPAALEALRTWTVRGGNLWIMLDRVSVETAAQLIGDAGGLTYVDRVGLTNVAFSAIGDGSPAPTAEDIREFETPVDMVRVIASGFERMYSVDGWDAAFSAPAGRGQVLITTVGPRAWIEPTTPACRSIGQQFWYMEEAPPDPDWAQAATGFIGYRVTSRTSVAATLILLWVAVLVAAFVFARSGRLTQLGWFAPAAALVATLFLFVRGNAARTAIPPTQASLQVAEYDTLGNVRVRGGLSLYSAADGDTHPGVRQGGALDFVEQPSGGVTRLIWSDFDAYHWENLSLTTGVHELRFDAVSTQSPAAAVLSFDKSGITGRLEGGDWTDPRAGLLVGPGGRFSAVHIDDDGGLTSDAGDLLARGTFSSDEVIGDREQSRINIYSQLLGPGAPLPAKSRLLFWAEPLDLGFDLQSESRRIGEALIDLPVVWRAPAPGEEVYLPASVVPFSLALNSKYGSSTAYDNRAREWMTDLRTKTYITLRFQLPRELAPFELQRLRVSIDLRAPERILRVCTLDAEDNETEIRTFESPVGPLEIDIDATKLPPLDDRLGFKLGFDVGSFQGIDESTLTTSPNEHGWHVNHVSLDAWGEVRP